MVITEKDSEEILKQITENGIIDDLILKLRGKSQPTDHPTHVANDVTDNVTKDVTNLNKRYLSVRIHNGAAFVDQLAEFEDGSFHRTTIQLIVQFKSERFRTSAVTLSVEPEFNSEFFFVLNEKLGNVEELLSTQEPLKIIALKCDKGGNQTVLSLKNIEWRECLNCKRRDIQVELNGLKNERSITIGTLRNDCNRFKGRDHSRFGGVMVLRLRLLHPGSILNVKDEKGVNIS